MTSPNTKPTTSKAALPDALTTASLGKIVLPFLERGIELAATELREKGMDLIAGPVVEAAHLAVHQSAEYAGVPSPVHKG
jgi:hypothetical protein